MSKQAKILESLKVNSLQAFRQFVSNKAESVPLSQAYRAIIVQVWEFSKTQDDDAANVILESAMTVDKEESQGKKSATRAFEHEVRAAMFCGKRNIPLVKTTKTGEKPVSARAARQAYEKENPTDMQAIKAYQDKHADTDVSITPEVIAEGHEILALARAESAKVETGRVESLDDALRLVDAMLSQHSPEAVFLIGKAISQRLAQRKKAEKSAKKAEQKAKEVSPESFAAVG